jgi:hypothetical protein
MRDAYTTLDGGTYVDGVRRTMRERWDELEGIEGTR